MIDWLTLRFDVLDMHPADYAAISSRSDTIMRVSCQTGAVEWSTHVRESIRSDSHAVTVHLGGHDLTIQGSPARVIGDGDAVFGSGASAADDIAGCALAMIDYLNRTLGLNLSRDLMQWKCSRIDITRNLALDSLAAVREALGWLKSTEGGRYRVSSKAGSTVYWGGASRLTRAKAYAKGPHLEYMISRDKCSYSPQQLRAAERILRLELTKGSQWFRERISCHWSQLTLHQLAYEWELFFNGITGSAEMTTEHDILQKLESIAPTKGQARAAWMFWHLVKNQGWDTAKEMTSRPTFYRHLSLLKSIGVGQADISNGQIIPFRRSISTYQYVKNWHELRAA